MAVGSIRNTLTVFGYRVQLQQVLLNLGMNVLDAMSSFEDSERQLEISMQYVDDQGRVQVRVNDSGTGQDPNTIARILEPLHTTKGRRYGDGTLDLPVHRSAPWRPAVGYA